MQKGRELCEKRMTVKIDRTDADIVRSIRYVLEWDAMVPDDRIQSTVSDGWVTLEGDVDSLREREEAEQAVLRMEGIVGVINKMRTSSLYDQPTIKLTPIH